MKLERPYVVVLAGGEGSRLAALTRALYGRDLPKQFAVLDGDRSLLQTTVERAACLTTLERILVVVTAHHADIARAQLAPYPGVELVVQPRSRDTAAGLLLPLARIITRTANARVIFMPSDHYIADEKPILSALRASAVCSLRGYISMIGIRPTAPETEYGWILSGRRIEDSSGHVIARFQEKPAPHVAEDLWRRGGLWNTFIQAGPVPTFWELTRRHLPRHAELFEQYAAAIGSADEASTLAAAYHEMPAASFSRDVLDHAEGLAVLPVAGSGWSDWGSPRRVFASLEGTPGHARLVERLHGASRTSPSTRITASRHAS